MIGSQTDCSQGFQNSQLGYDIFDPVPSSSMGEGRPVLCVRGVNGVTH